MTSVANTKADASTVSSFMACLRHRPARWRRGRSIGVVGRIAARSRVERLTGPAARRGQRHRARVHAVLAVTRQEAIDRHGLADLQRLAAPTLALQAVRRSHL